MVEMTPRERIQTTLDRQEPDKAPKTAAFCPALLERFRKETGAENPALYFAMEPRAATFGPAPEPLTDFRPYFPKDLPAETHFNEYGIASVPGNFYHFSRFAYPMLDFTAIDQIEAYPWPDTTAKHRHDHLENRVRELHDADFFVQGPVGHIFEFAWQMRGMDNLLMDLVDNEEFAARILDRFTEDKMFRAKRLYGDKLAFWGTIGIQTTMPFGSPDDVRETVRERMGTVGKGGGLLLAPTHVLEPDVPWENVLAFFEAVETYGRYP